MWRTSLLLQREVTGEAGGEKNVSIDSTPIIGVKANQRLLMFFVKTAAISNLRETVVIAFLLKNYSESLCDEYIR